MQENETIYLNTGYVVLVFSKPVSPIYDTVKEAEDAIKLLDPAHQLIAEIVPWER